VNAVAEFDIRQASRATTTTPERPVHAHELMTGDPAVITANDTITAAAELMRTRDVGMLPVVDGPADRHLIGVITDRDIVLRAVARGHGPDAKVHEHMSREGLVTVAPTASVDDIVAKMKLHQVRRLPVVSAAGSVVGVVAQADVAIAVGPRDPRLVEQLMEGISRPGALVPSE
jgi:CBS domain-containing protein